MRIDNLSPVMGASVATGWEPEGLSDTEVADGEAYHRALYHNGDTNRPVNWHKNSVAKLIEVASPHIKDGSLVVDYGCGTGTRQELHLKSCRRVCLDVPLKLILK